MRGPQPNRELYKTPNLRVIPSPSREQVSQVEKAILSELGLSTNVKEMKLGDVQYLRDYLFSAIQLPLPSNLIEIVSGRGYQWRDEPSIATQDPSVALYLDAYARLNELSQASTRIPDTKYLLGSAL